MNNRTAQVQPMYFQGHEITPINFDMFNKSCTAMNFESRSFLLQSMFPVLLDGVKTGVSLLHSNQPSHFYDPFTTHRSQSITLLYGCIPVHLDFILPVHLDHHTSGSSRPSYLWFIQSFHTSGSSRFYSYLWFIQIIFIPLVHLEHHTSGTSRLFSYLWFIQNFIPPVHLDFYLFLHIHYIKLQPNLNVT